MSSFHLPSIFHHNSNKKESATPPRSLLSKRSTISSSSRSQYEESVISNNNVKPTPQRSNTLSKVKRFGSLLTRNKRSNTDPSFRRTRVDTIFPPNIDTSLANSAPINLSASSSRSNINTASSDEDEETLLTPNTLITSSTHFTTKTSSPNNAYFDHKSEIMTTMVSPSIPIRQNIDGVMSVTPQEKEQQQLDHMPFVDEPEQLEDVTGTQDLSLSSKDSPTRSNTYSEQQYDNTLVKEEQQEVEKEEVDPSTLSGVALVRYHLRMALKEVDVEIEDELKTCREEMIKTINTVPTMTFYSSFFPL